MKKKITLNNKEIHYLIRKSNRAKRMRIAVFCNADVVITLPHTRTNLEAEKYLKEKSKWVLEKLDKFATTTTNNKPQTVDFEEGKELAGHLVKKIIKKHKKQLNCEYNSINIKDHKTKWGSCSKKGNLNFNYRIIFLKKKLAEYIVVHELCHLAEMNHSQKFWKLIEKALPNYKKLQEELKITL